MNRWAQAGSALVVLGMLGGLFTEGVLAGRFAFAELITQRHRLDGQDVTLPLAAITAQDGDRWTVRKSSRSFDLVGAEGDVGVGDEVYVFGRYEADRDVIVVREILHAPARPAKFRLAFVGLALLPLLVLAGVRWAPGEGLALRG